MVGVFGDDGFGPIHDSGARPEFQADNKPVQPFGGEDVVGVIHLAGLIDAGEQLEATRWEVSVVFGGDPQICVCVAGRCAAAIESDRGGVVIAETGYIG